MSTFDRTDLPDPSTAPDLFDGVLLRRSLAFIIDTVILGFIATIILFVGTIAGFLTFGLAWLSLPIVIPPSSVTTPQRSARPCGRPWACR